MSRVHSLTDPQYVSGQYRQAANLNARIRLHQQFSANPYGWQRWLFDRFEFPPGGRLLELGCGAGSLWLDNLERLPAGLELVLSDLSAGMVQQAQRSLAGQAGRFRFARIDAQALPFETHSVDVVLANHMLYHLPDRPRALAEIRRVLKPAGRFYASTVGENHMKELDDLIARFDPQLAGWGQPPPGSFSLENGQAQLERYFARVELSRYPDALLVTQAGPLVDYVLSGRLELDAGQQARLAGFVEQALQAGGGQMHVTKDSGVFAAS